MKLRLALAASATCLAVVLPTFVRSAGPIGSAAAPASTSVATTSSPTKVLDGKIVEVHADSRRGAAAAPESGSEQWLQTADGSAYQLHFITQPKLDTQTPVRVTGTVSGNQVTVASAVSSTVNYSTTGTTRTGVHSVFIMMVNWTRPDGTSPAAAQAQVGVTTNNWYRSVSHGKFGFAARATPWMTIPRQDCGLASGGYWKVLAAAEKAAIAHGYKPNAYNHEMVYFPFDAKCNYGGLGSVNDRQSWVNGEMNSRVTNHELGHNIGLNHARSATCLNSTNRQVTVSTRCTTNEYGDLFDTMGVPISGSPGFSALQLNHLGWLNGRFATPVRSGSIAITPLEKATGTAAVRIRVRGAEYWLEYRQPIGVDASLSQSRKATNGVLIHRVGAGGGTDLLDGTPDSAKSFTDAALAVGRTWTSPAGLSVKVSSVSSTRAVVSIQIPSA